MKLVRAVFVLVNESRRTDDPPRVHVEFRGKDEVRVTIGETMTKLQNKAWRPCVTHAIEIVNHVTGKSAVNAFARQRRREAKPMLRLAKFE